MNSSTTPASDQPHKESTTARKTEIPLPKESPRESTFAKAESRERKTWGSRNDRKPARQLSPQEVADIENAETVCAELMDALDDNDNAAILAKARALINHPNPEVRMRVLDALNWAGSDALYDLADMLDDENTEIADAATESFWEQIADLPNDQAKLNLLDGFAQNQNPDMLSHIAEELSNYHPHVAYDLILSVLSASPNTVNEDVQWELEGMTGESFETTPEWKKWFIGNKADFEADYKEQGF